MDTSHRFNPDAPVPVAGQTVSDRGLGAQAPQVGPTLVPIREIGARYRPKILQHLLELGERDRYLRFGYAAQDHQIANYVEQLNFERDQVFGIFNRRLQLIAMAHLAHSPELSEQGQAEFGVSVSPHARGRGYGALLFDRAVVHAVNLELRQLVIHALSENVAMLHIARKAGAEIERCGSESQAVLGLPQASLKTRLDELLADQLAQIDYLLKREAHVRGAAA